MPGERVSMRKIRDVLAAAIGPPATATGDRPQPAAEPGAVSEYLKRARAGLTWPLPDELDDAQLEVLLFSPAPDVPAGQRPLPDWSALHREMRRPNVTLALL
jgi:hypothetical protein